MDTFKQALRSAIRRQPSDVTILDDEERELIIRVQTLAEGVAVLTDANVDLQAEAESYRRPLAAQEDVFNERALAVGQVGRA